MRSVSNLLTVGLVARYIAWKLVKEVGASLGGFPVTQNSSPEHPE
jgi:hypothetical protein